MSILEEVKLKQKEVLDEKTKHRQEVINGIENIAKRFKKDQNKNFKLYEELLELRENVTEDSIQEVDKLIKSARTFSIQIGYAKDGREAKMGVAYEGLRNNNYEVDFLKKADRSANYGFDLYTSENKEFNLDKPFEEQVKDWEYFTNNIDKMVIYSTIAFDEVIPTIDEKIDNIRTRLFKAIEDGYVVVRD